MKRLLVITDLTRMREGRVCIAGYDAKGNCIRPVLPPPGIHESTLFSGGRPIVYPFAIVEYDLLEHTPEPPHTEDHRYDPTSVRFVRRVKDKNRPRVFEWSLFDSVSAIFEQPIHDDFGFHVMDGRGPRSLGTIRPWRVIKAIHEQAPEGMWKYRLGFVDGEGATYWLTVTDLAWRYYCDHQRRIGHEPGKTATALTAVLKSSEVYLRIGLARGWARFPDRCYLQITGAYTFPDYLQGKTFADFTPG